MSATNLPDALLKRIRGGNRFLVTSHQNPDGDAIGSSLGMARILRSLGKTATVWLKDETPSIYRQLPGVERIHVGPEPPAGYPEGLSAIIVMECPSLDRTGLEEHLATGPPLLNVDHHLGNQLYGAVNWVDPTAPAVGEMVLRLATALHASLTEDTSNLLLTALVSDTGGFRFSNARELAFQAAAELVRAGAKPELVSMWLYESNPLSRVELLREMLGTLELHHDGRVATVRLTPEMFAATGAAAGDAEGLVDTPRSIAGVEAVALLRGIGEGEIKISLRSRGAVDVEAIAREHSGGGHHNAAGCRFQGSYDEAKGAMVTALGAALA
jgi:bifunctional oligoribonuclease and PAP phosphatase NrnA